jgi:2-keto-4-pentenoate hydratase/2-oxohepta-3-ene-1,7-dioic acid hydratase in catechol pathway
VKIVVFGPERRVGALAGDQVVDLNRAYERMVRGGRKANAGERVPAELGAFIADGSPALEAAQRALDHAITAGPDTRTALIVQPAHAVKLHAPWAHKRIACAGGNFAAHTYRMLVSLGRTGVTLESESQRIRDDGQWGFWKVLDEVAGPDEDVPFPARTEYLDYEGEVVIVIGKRGKDIKPDRIGDFVWGVTLGNDWSIRDDKHEMRFAHYNLMKNFDCSASLGPCIVVGELDPQKVDLETRVNGELRQQYSTKDMVFSFGEILAHLSRDLTFLPGDLIFGGTSEGTAMDSTPLSPDGSRPKDRFLKVGQTVTVSSPQIGTLQNGLAPRLLEA